jgi:2,4-dienoyl-CoA reductase-like NADH-dependent reductase (Old Yellow Enzyme family)
MNNSEDMNTSTDAGSLLFSPIKLRSIVARNRIVVSPMCQYASVEGGPTDWHMVHFGKFAVGGAGVVFAEETAVEAGGRKTYDCAGIYADRHVAAYRRICEFIKSVGAVPAMQLGHCGRRAATHGAMQGWRPLTEADTAAGRPPWQPMSASAVPATPHSQIPRSMDRDDIRANIAAWREAALRSVDAGFDICEIHGAHGYLIHQFLSPLSNKRNDAYGGDLSGRMRFALEVVDAVRAAWPADRPLFFRVSAVEGAGGEWTMKDTLVFAQALKEHGVDVIDCSAGGITGDTQFSALPRVPGFQAGFASEVKRMCGMPTMAVGLITTGKHAEMLLQEGHADLIALARELMYDPNWPLHAAIELNHTDPFSLVPAAEAYRLKGRLDQTRAIVPGSAVVVPFDHDRAIPFSWDALIADPNDADDPLVGRGV